MVGHRREDSGKIRDGLHAPLEGRPQPQPHGQGQRYLDCRGGRAAIEARGSGGHEGEGRTSRSTCAIDGPTGRRANGNPAEASWFVLPPCLPPCWQMGSSPVPEATLENINHLNEDDSQEMTAASRSSGIPLNKEAPSGVRYRTPSMYRGPLPQIPHLLLRH